MGVAVKRPKKVKFTQGQYVPKNFKKYKGTVPIIYRSSWELSFMMFLDSCSNVLEWGSESFIVDYVSPVDRRRHRYFLDFNIKVVNRLNETKRFVIEIKPEYKLKPPKSGSLQAKAEFAINMAKWASANIIAQKRNSIFMIITEKNSQEFMDMVRRG